MISGGELLDVWQGFCRGYSKCEEISEMLCDVMSEKSKTSVGLRYTQ